MGTDQPFDEAVRGVLAERGLTFRALAARTVEADGSGKGLSHSYLATLGAHEPPTLRAMEVVAAALDLKPTYFAEYRLALARGLFDEQQQGLTRALENLQALRELAAEQGASPPAGRLASLLRSALEKPPRRRAPAGSRARR
jgi:transcriptional regulator with XRE-family HTH domain